MEPIFPKDYVNPAPEPVKDKRLPAVRGDGDAVYLVENETKHWVVSASIYEKLGYRFGDEKNIGNTELANIKTGEVITNKNWEKYKTKEEEQPIAVEAEVIPPPDDVQPATATMPEPNL